MFGPTSGVLMYSHATDRYIAIAYTVYKPLIHCNCCTVYKLTKSTLNAQSVKIEMMHVNVRLTKVVKVVKVMSNVSALPHTNLSV